MPNPTGEVSQVHPGMMTNIPILQRYFPTTPLAKRSGPSKKVERRGHPETQLPGKNLCCFSLADAIDHSTKTGGRKSRPGFRREMLFVATRTGSLLN